MTMFDISRDAAPDIEENEDPLLRFRDRFPIVGTTNYLVSHSLGAMPAETADDLAEFAAIWASRGVRAWGDRWWLMVSELGDRLAPLIGAPTGSVVIHQNVTTAQAVILSSFDYSSSRNRVVMVEGEFPSTRYVYDGLATRLGAEIVTVPADASGLGVDLERLLAAIDERTLLVPLSHVLFQSSFLIDARAVARRCREVGATLVLDVFQSAGILPVDLTAWDVPIAVGGVLKWLCGGPGAAFLYVEPGLRSRLQPSFTGWMAHESPFSFDPPPMRFRNDVLKLALGTPPVASMYAAQAGPRILAEAAKDGMEGIRAKSVRQTSLLMRLAEERGYELRTPSRPEERGGSVSINVPHAREVAMELNVSDIVCDFRPHAGIRFSPHFYTRDAELMDAMNAVDDILASGRWKRHEQVEKIVT